MLYDFEGDTPSGELVVYTDEVLTVTRTVRVVICEAFFTYCFPLDLNCCYLFSYYFVTASLQDVGDGWWEGISPNGARGLFPEAYVEVKFEHFPIQFNRISKFEVF